MVPQPTANPSAKQKDWHVFRVEDEAISLSLGLWVFGVLKPPLLHWLVHKHNVKGGILGDQKDPDADP